MPVLKGTAAADRIVGSAEADQIYGLDANDTLYGLDGSDLLNGGLGDDILVGGLGNDTYYVGSAGDQVVERAGEGIDRVLAWVGHQLAANVEILTLAGTADINGFGNALNNTIVGNAGNNVLNGGAGKDAMAGGVGNDVYDVDSSSDVVSEGTNAGYDRVRALVSYTLSANVEELNMTGTAAINGTGNALANTIIGNASNNILAGGGGDDQIFGSGGDDILKGGAGKDYVNGGAGNDWFDEDKASLVSEEIYDGGNGYDIFHIAGNYKIPVDISDIVFKNFEKLMIPYEDVQISVRQSLSFKIIEAHEIKFVDSGNIDLSKLDLDVVRIVLSDGGNYLKLDPSELGIFGASVHGGMGRDVVVGRDSGSTIFGGGGNDIITGGINFDQISGDSGDDVIIGKGGDDILAGGEGSDQLTGGTGSDSFYFKEAQGEDMVTDFSPSEDNLSFEDLLHGLFLYLGSGSFSGSGNTEARFADGKVFVDSDGDGITDITIRLSGITTAAQLSDGNFAFW